MLYVNCSWDKTLWPVPLGKLSRGLVFVCADHNNHKVPNRKTEAVPLLFPFLLTFQLQHFISFWTKKTQVYYWSCGKSATVWIWKEIKRIHHFSAYKSSATVFLSKSLTIITHQLDWEKLHSNLISTHSNTNIYNYKTSFVYDLLIWYPWQI